MKPLSTLLVHGTHSENGSCFILKWMLWDTCLCYGKGHSNFCCVTVLIVYNTSFVFGYRTPWTSCPCTCRLRRRLAYGIQQSTAARYLLLIPASWWCPSYPVPAWQIPYVKSACFSNMDARASSYTKLSSWSGILNPGSPHKSK